MSRLTPLLVTVVSLSVAASPIAQAQTRATVQSGLKIVVLEGEDAVNVIQQKTAVAPLIEVRDRNDQPVAGAVVTFSIKGGHAAFAAGANTMSVTTNALGQAAVTGLTPTSAGAVQINVAAAFGGQTATATISQTNFMTAAQAASGGGGGIGAGTITTLSLVGAGAAGGWYAYKKYEEGEPPAIAGFEVFPSSGLAAITPINPSGHEMTWHGEGARVTYDFGDGQSTTASLDFAAGNPFENTGHVYQLPGTYTITMTIVDAWDRSATARTTVTIKSLTGRWGVNTTGDYFTLAQQATSLSGTYTRANAQTCGIASGSVRQQSANNVSITAPCPTANATFVGTTDFASPDIIAGTLTVGSSSTSVRLNRQ